MPFKSSSQFLAVQAALRDHPEALVTFLVRNFNEPDAVRVLVGPPTRYLAHCKADLAELFPSLRGWITANTDPHGMIPVCHFTNDGNAIGKLLGRSLHIAHQFGSGRLEEAEFKGYDFPHQAN